MEIINVDFVPICSFFTAAACWCNHLCMGNVLGMYMLMCMQTVNIISQDFSDDVDDEATSSSHLKHTIAGCNHGAGK